MTENWRPVVGWEGFYEVSDLGRVKSLPRTTIKSDGNRQVTKGRILSGKATADGYRAVALRRPGVYTSGRVHRLVLSAFVGPCPPEMEACHNNGDRTDNRLENLRWDTKSANTLDKIAHGTHPQARITHCPQGHPYDEENTYRRPGRSNRACRTCSRARSVAAKARARGLADHDVDILLVARHVAASALSGKYATEVDWENYPEIGEFDWEAVVAQVDEIRNGLTVERFVYEAAYARLAARADEALPDGTFTLDPMEATA